VVASSLFVEGRSRPIRNRNQKGRRPAACGARTQLTNDPALILILGWGLVGVVVTAAEFVSTSIRSQKCGSRVNSHGRGQRFSPVYVPSGENSVRLSGPDVRTGGSRWSLGAPVDEVFGYRQADDPGCSDQQRPGQFIYWSYQQDPGDGYDDDGSLGDADGVGPGHPFTVTDVVPAPHGDESQDDEDHHGGAEDQSKDEEQRPVRGGRS
jgi:hypothetical protein